MIVFRRMGGELIGLNPDLIERVEETPDTVVTLVGGAKFLVEESLGDVLRLVTDYRAYVLWRSGDLQITEHGRGGGVLHVVPDDRVTSPENALIAGQAGFEIPGDHDEGVDLLFDAVRTGNTAERGDNDWADADGDGTADLGGGCG